MKKKVTVSKQDNVIEFYLHLGNQRFLLFVQKYTKSVYDFFARGRSENEIRSFKRWNRNPRLDKTIMKIPVYMRYILKYEA